MLRTLRIFAIVAITAASLSSLAYGQAAAMNGEIAGSVTDTAAAAVSGAIVQIVNPGTGFKQATRTENSGLFRFRLLPLGTYELTAQAEGFTDAGVPES